MIRRVISFYGCKCGERDQWRNRYLIKQKLVPLVTLVSLLIVTVSQSFAANKSFIRLNANEISQISDRRLFFVTSEHGFVHSRKTGSPLQDEIPSEINVSKYQKTQSIDTVLLQAIKTKEQDFKTLEGGLPGGKWVWMIIGGVLGSFIAPFFRQEQFVGAIVGAVAVLLIASSIFESDDFRLYVDNATDQDVLLAIDSFSPIAIAGRSQIGVKFKEGTHNVKTLKASDNSVLDSFDLQATEYRDGSGDTVSGYYIYNVAARNNYTAHHVAYSPK